MRSLTLAAGIAILAFPLSAARGATLTLGGPLSQLCYQAALDQNDSSSAIDDCSRSLNEEPMAATDLAATYVNRGVLHMMHGDDASAEADFNSAITRDRSLADGWLNKGFLRLRQGKARDALAFLQEGISRKPQREALAIFARGVAYEQMGQLQSAYVDLQRAHELEPGWALPSEYLARYQVVAR